MIEQIQLAKFFGMTPIDSLLQEMLLGGKTRSLLIFDYHMMAINPNGLLSSNI